MDINDLKSASNYVNNMLAGRGLLRDSPIDFARPSREGTAARIINLVHELMNRRDKDAEQRESLGITIRTLRSNEVKHTSSMEKLKSQIVELERKNGFLEGQTRTFNITLSTAEATAKVLKDEAGRLKTTLAQVRTQHANDLRKRDIHIKTMKEKLLDTRRNTRAPISTVVINGGGFNSTSLGSSDSSSKSPVLSQDTSDFLTSLSQNLADENDNLLALLRQCISTLKEIQGFPDHNQALDLRNALKDAANPVVAVPADYNIISLELDRVMQSLQAMVNQPNFVPLEELAGRDEEIAQLKERNVLLEQEWRKALNLVDTWNKTIQKSSINEERNRGRIDSDSISSTGHIVDVMDKHEVLSHTKSSFQRSISPLGPIGQQLKDIDATENQNNSHSRRTSIRINGKRQRTTDHINESSISKRRQQKGAKNK